MVLKYCVVFCCLGLLIVYGNCKKLPSFIQVCPRHPQVGDCVKKNVEIIQDKLQEGDSLPALFIPSFKPFIVSQATLYAANNFTADFKDIELYNLEKFKLEDLVFDTKNWKVKFTVFFPTFSIKSSYSVKGPILLLQVDGNGVVHGNYSDVRATVAAQLTTFEKDGKTHLKANKDSMELNIGKARWELEGLFGEDEELNAQANKMINDNGPAVIEAVKPVVKDVIFKIGLGVSNRVFEKYSLDELFPLP